MTLRGSIDVDPADQRRRIGGGDRHRDRSRAPSQLYGPGDIIGIDAGLIVRTEPRHWITNFETNYLPFVEFYDEDFPVALHARQRLADEPRGCGPG